jgi:hypothetical protein
MRSFLGYFQPPRIAAIELLALCRLKWLAMLSPEGPFNARESCPACQSPRAATLHHGQFTDEPLHGYLKHYYQRPIPPGTYQLDRCLDCSLVFQRFVGTNDFLIELYSQWIDREIDAAYDSVLAAPAASRDGHELTTLSAYLGKPRLKVLDYGAGWGLWPIIAKRLGHHAYAVELAPEKARWMAQHGVSVIADDELREHRFDVINLEQSLEHLTEPRALLHSLVPALAGVLKISVPNAGDAQRTVSDIARGDYSTIMIVHPFEHINAFTSQSLGALAKASALREVRPSLRQRYSFLSGGLPRRVSALAKELVRPLWTFNNSHNLYRWFVRA